MKKLLLLLFVTVVAFSSCKRYEDGPSMSLRSAKARIVGEWELEKMYINKIDVSDELLREGGLQLIFKKNGDYEEYFAGDRDGGKWEFNSGKDKVIISFKYETITYNITRLTKKQFWMFIDDDDEKIEVEMKKK